MTEEAARERIAKRIARAGRASRREAEALIEARRVTLNGATVDTPATLVGDNDVIAVDGVALAAVAPPRLWRYHKPTGLVVTRADPQGRPTVFDNLPGGLPRVISIGRLDLTSEGLLLLTNDGALARYLELPATAWLRRYRARVFGTIEPDRLTALRAGIEVDGVRYGPINARVDSAKASNAWLTISLGEGKNREIRKVLGHLGLTVSRLIRTSFGPFQLGNLAAGAVEEVTGKVLREHLRADWRKSSAASATPPRPKAQPRPGAKPRPGRKAAP